MAKGASAVGTAMCSGEGGILPDEQEAAGSRYIFEVAPNKYLLTDENLARAGAVEIKIGQGTKPGMGGHLPGEKVTDEAARIRGCEPGVGIASPSTFPGIHSIRDLREFVHELRVRSKGAPVGIKLAAGQIERDVAAAVRANADYITIDGRGGATGASPIVLRDAASVPTVYALVRTRLSAHAGFSMSSAPPPPSSSPAGYASPPTSSGPSPSARMPSPSPPPPYGARLPAVPYLRHGPLPYGHSDPGPEPEAQPRYRPRSPSRRELLSRHI